MAGVTSAALWALSVAEMNFSLLAGRSGWWGAVYMTVIFMSRGESHLPGTSAGTARGLGTPPVDELPHCAGTLQGWEKRCFRTREADPSFAAFCLGV